MAYAAHAILDIGAGEQAGSARHERAICVTGGV